MGGKEPSPISERYDGTIILGPDQLAHPMGWWWNKHSPHHEVTLNHSFVELQFTLVDGALLGLEASVALLSVVPVCIQVWQVCV